MSTAGTLDHAELEASARAQIAGASSTEQLTAVEQALARQALGTEGRQAGPRWAPPEERREAGAVPPRGPAPDRRSARGAQQGTGSGGAGGPPGR